MFKISLIVASDVNGVLAVDGNIPWHHPADFQRFKELTLGGHLIMGRKTWESLPTPIRAKEGLPGRHNIVITRKKGYRYNSPGVSIVHSLDDALTAATSSATYPGPIWIIGGAEVYRQALKSPDLDRVCVVDEVDYTVVPTVTVEPNQTVTYFEVDWLNGFVIDQSKHNSNDDQLIHYKLIKRDLDETWTKFDDLRNAAMEVLRAHEQENTTRSLKLDEAIMGLSTSVCKAMTSSMSMADIFFASKELERPEIQEALRQLTRLIGVLRCLME